jgi:hypothetical protein
MSEVRALFRVLLASMRLSRVSRDAEILFLRQLLMLRRSAQGRLRLSNTDRLIFVRLYPLFPSLLESAVIFKPETLVRWHRGGFSPVLAPDVTAASRPPDENAPIGRPVQASGCIVPMPIPGDLHHQYVQMA